MGTKTIGAQIEDDTELYQEFDEWASEYHSRSEAVRAALREAVEGDDTQQKSEKPTPDILRDMGLAALAFAVVATLVSPDWIVVVLGGCAALLLVGSAGYRWRAS